MGTLTLRIPHVGAVVVLAIPWRRVFAGVWEVMSPMRSALGAVAVGQRASGAATCSQRCCKARPTNTSTSSSMTAGRPRRHRRHRRQRQHCSSQPRHHNFSNRSRRRSPSPPQPQHHPASRHTIHRPRQRHRRSPCHCIIRSHHLLRRRHPRTTPPPPSQRLAVYVRACW